MSSSQPKPPKNPPGQKPAAKGNAGAGQSDRLATALRDNLKRRKAQARARGGRPEG
jgi:hypothetical protein